MTHRLRLVCIVALSFLTSAALALGQGISFGGLGNAGGLAPGSYQSLGTVPALLGQTNAGASGKFRHSARASESGDHGHEGTYSHQHPTYRYPRYGYYSPDFAFWVPGYLASYYGGGYADAYAYSGAPYPQSGGQQSSNGTQSQSQNSNQNQGMNGNQNQNQNQNNQGQGKEQAPPPKPQYLTYSPKKKTLQEQAKSGKALAVNFKSVPSGAQITVDGYFVGHTPTTAQIPLGKHLVSITKWGYQSWEEELNVTGNKPVSVNPTLHKDW